MVSKGMSNEDDREESWRQTGKTYMSTPIVDRNTGQQHGFCRTHCQAVARRHADNVHVPAALAGLVWKSRRQLGVRNDIRTAFSSATACVPPEDIRPRWDRGRMLPTIYPHSRGHTASGARPRLRALARHPRSTLGGKPRRSVRRSAAAPLAARH